MGNSQSNVQIDEEVTKDLKPDPTHSHIYGMKFEDKMKIVMQYADDKLSWHNIPEHPFDHNPVLENTPPLVERVKQIPRFDIASICKEKDENALKNYGDQIVEQLNTNGCVILKISPEYLKDMSNFYTEARVFFDKEIDDKIAYGPKRDKEGLAREGFSGYSTIIFDNRDSIRDPEVRDIFQMRLFEQDINWPHPGFKETATHFYNTQFDLSLQVLRAISLATGHSADHFTKLVSSPSPDVSPQTSQNSNMCVFHYWDHFGYKTEQRCMIHEDNGFLTMLPPATAPGLHLLDSSASSKEDAGWIEMEKLIEQDEMILYCGKSLEYVTGGAVTASTHRVVRAPKTVRYSCPFELKPTDAAVLVEPNTGETCTGKEFYVNFDWERVQRKVHRGNIANGEEVKEKVDCLRQSMESPADSYLEGRGFLATSVDIEA